MEIVVYVSKFHEETNEEFIAINHAAKKKNLKLTVITLPPEQMSMFPMCVNPETGIRIDCASYQGLSFKDFKETVLDFLPDSNDLPKEVESVESTSNKLTPEEKLKAFAEKCSDKFVPLLTSAGVCSITSSEVIKEVANDITIRVRPFNSDLDKWWTGEITSAQIFYVRLPLALGFIFEPGWWYKSSVSLQQFAAIKAAIATMIEGEVMEVISLGPNKP